MRSRDAPRSRAAAALVRLTLVAAFVSPAVVAAPTRPVTERDTITIGYQASAFPFTYLGPEGEYIGYSVDLCQRVVQEIARRRGRPLQVRPFAVTSRTRIAHLLAGNIDLECGSTSNTADRAALGVQFSLVTFVSDVAVLAREGPAHLRRVEDLKKLERDAPIVTTAGSTAARYLRDLEQRLDASLQVVSAAHHGESFRMLMEGRAGAFVMDRVLLKARLAWESQCAGGAAHGLHFLEGEVSPEAVEHYGIMMRERDRDLKEVVDATLKALMQSGDIAVVYDKWFLRPIPGMAELPRCAGAEDRRAIGLEMPPALKRLFEQPRDTPFEPAPAPAAAQR